MDYIPDPEKCIKILRETGCSKIVIDHCKAVRNIAIKIAKKTKADVELVETGALLHDIGRSKINGILHAIEGVRILEELKISQKIIRIVERHIGAGLSKDNAKKLGLPPKNYIPETIEEKIVCHADNLIDNCKRRKIEYEIERALKEGKNDYALRLVNLHKELSENCGIDLNDI